jgi:sulfur carrier protein
MMQIKVNGEQKEISTEVSLLQLLDLLQLSAGQGLALAVNEQVVARSKWSDFVLNDGDQVIIIKATAGG